MPTNVAALSRLLITERHSLVRWVARIVGSEPAAEDVAQSVYLRVQMIADHPPILNKRSFLFRLASNVALDYVRAARRHDDLFIGGVDPSQVASREPNIETRLLDQEKVHHIARIVETMPLRCRQVFTLIKIDGTSVTETASRLGISQDMVRKHIRHALQICHQALTDDGAE